MKNAASACYLFLGVAFTLHASPPQYEDQDTFFVNLRKKYGEHYKLCTGDTSVPSAQELLEWKKGINLATESTEYRGILKEFIAHTGVVKGIIPCQVLKWNRDRFRQLQSRENTLRDRMLVEADTSLTAYRIKAAMERNPASVFDFAGIPFGLCRSTFVLLFSHRYIYSLVGRGTHVYVEHFPLRGNSYMVRFHFSPDNRYYKYEIIGCRRPAQLLDGIVRPMASDLAGMLEERAGPPDRIFRIGFFDIKSKTITPHARWDQETCSATVGLGMERNQYFASLVVTNRETGDVAKSTGTASEPAE